MKREHFMAAGWIIIALVLFAFMLYRLIVWYTYPCEAYKTGWLSLGYAPARCIQ